MKNQLGRHAACLILPAGMWGCAAPAPEPVGGSHPASPEAASAPVTRLQVLQTYQDFAGPDTPAPAQRVPQHGDNTQTKERPDAHEH